MKGRFRINEESTVNVIVFSVGIIALVILFVLLVFFLINQATLIRQFEEAVDLYKTVLRVQSADGAAIPADNMSLLWNEKIKYLEQLNTMHKQVSTTDLFVFICSLLIGVSGYLIKKSELRLENASNKYLEFNENADKLEKEISDKYIKLKENADKLEQKISNNDKYFFVLQILSDAITDISTYKHTLENGYLAHFRYEVRQIAEWIKNIKLDEIDLLISTKLEQRFGTIRGLYEDISEDPNYLITKNHRKSVQKDFDKIKSKLDEIQGIN